MKWLSASLFYGLAADRQEQRYYKFFTKIGNSGSLYRVLKETFFLQYLRRLRNLRRYCAISVERAMQDGIVRYRGQYYCATSGFQ